MTRPAEYADQPYIDALDDDVWAPGCWDAGGCGDHRCGQCGDRRLMEVRYVDVQQINSVDPLPSRGLERPIVGCRETEIVGLEAAPPQTAKAKVAHADFPDDIEVTPFADNEPETEWLAEFANQSESEVSNGQVTRSTVDGAPIAGVGMTAEPAF